VNAIQHKLAHARKRWTARLVYSTHKLVNEQESADKKVVLSQGAPRDAAVNFHRILQ